MELADSRGLEAAAGGSNESHAASSCLRRKLRPLGRQKFRWNMRSRPSVLGFSQGGMLAFLLSARGRAFCGAISLAGVLPRSAMRRWPRRGCATPHLALHGREDTVLPLERTRRRVEAIRRRGAAGGEACTLSLLTFEAGHEMNSAMLSVVRRVLTGKTRSECAMRLQNVSADLATADDVEHE